MTSSNSQIKVAILDDHDIVSEGIEHILRLASDIRVVVKQTIPEGFLQEVRVHRVDVVLLDIHVPKMDFFEMLDDLLALRPVSPRIIIISSSVDWALVNAICKRGVLGYLDKDDSLSELLSSAIRGVAKGERHYSQSVLALMTNNATDSRSFNLTDLQLLTLKMLREGKTYPEIAAHLDMSREALRALRWRMRQALKVRNDREAVTKAQQLGLI